MSKRILTVQKICNPKSFLLNPHFISYRRFSAAPAPAPAPARLLLLVAALVSFKEFNVLSLISLFIKLLI
jgi:hypothetical protein